MGTAIMVDEDDAVVMALAVAVVVVVVIIVVASLRLTSVSERLRRQSVTGRMGPGLGDCCCWWEAPTSELWERSFANGFICSWRSMELGGMSI